MKGGFRAAWALDRITPYQLALIRVLLFTRAACQRTAHQEHVLKSVSLNRECHIWGQLIELGSHRFRTPAANLWGWTGIVMGDLCLCQHKSALGQSNQTKFQHMS